jgi:hypothetical protein
MRLEVATLSSKQFGEYRLSILHDRREFMQIILTNSDSTLKRWGELQLSVVNGGKYRLCAINNSGESIKNCEYLIEF